MRRRKKTWRGTGKREKMRKILKMKEREVERETEIEKMKKYMRRKKKKTRWKGMRLKKKRWPDATKAYLIDAAPLDREYQTPER
jgi:hypothetical protein